jgi:hypothetical protein
MTRAAAKRAPEEQAVNAMAETAPLERCSEAIALVRPANTNTSALVETWPVGDPRTTARLLAQILVRRALVDLGIVPDDPRPERQHRTKYPARSGVTLPEPEEDHR